MTQVGIRTRPDVIVTDFDRTLTYLYQNPVLLPKLADKIRLFYDKFIEVEDLGRETDGYMVWHKLHEASVKKLHQTTADLINKQAEEIVAEYELQIVKRIGIFPGISDAIRCLRANGIRLGVVSSNATSVVTYAMKEANILNEFEYIGGRPNPFDPKLIKPNPYPIRKALQIMKAEQETCWYVGDDRLDMEAAVAANIGAVGVCTGRHSETELKEAGADLVFQSFIHLPEYLQSDRYHSLDLRSADRIEVNYKEHKYQ